MKALAIQKQLNNTLAARKPNYMKAFDLYTTMNDQRRVEGLPFLSLPNLEKRICEIPLETIYNFYANK